MLNTSNYTPRVIAKTPFASLAEAIEEMGEEVVLHCANSFLNERAYRYDQNKKTRTNEKTMLSELKATAKRLEMTPAEVLAKMPKK